MLPTSMPRARQLRLPFPRLATPQTDPRGPPRVRLIKPYHAGSEEGGYYRDSQPGLACAPL